MELENYLAEKDLEKVLKVYSKDQIVEWMTSVGPNKRDIVLSLLIFVVGALIISRGVWTSMLIFFAISLLIFLVPVNAEIRCQLACLRGQFACLRGQLANNVCSSVNAADVRSQLAYLHSQLLYLRSQLAADVQTSANADLLRQLADIRGQGADIRGQLADLRVRVADLRIQHADERRGRG